MASQEELLERIAGAFAALAAECREDGGRVMDVGGLLAEARMVLGELDAGALARLLADAAETTYRDAAACGLDPVALSFVAGLRVGEKLGYGRAVREGAH